MARPHALLRAGFPYLKTIGMRRITSGPVDLAIGQEGRLYILCRGTIQTEIRSYDFEDNDYGPISGSGSMEGKLQWPAAIIADSQENLLVSDEASHRISTFTKDGNYLGSWGQQGNQDGQFNRPSGMAFDSVQNVYVADTLNHRIQKFTKDGTFLIKFGEYGASDGNLNMPWGISVDEVDNVYVADWRNDRIAKFTSEGDFLMNFGESGNGDGQFNRPSGVTVDVDGDIYVADRGNNRVQLFDRYGTYVEKFIGDATLSPSGRKYILSNAVTLRLRETASSLEPVKRLRGPISVKVDACGHMYIPDYGSHRVQIYKKETYDLDETQIAPVPRSPTLYTA